MIAREHYIKKQILDVEKKLKENLNAMHQENSIKERQKLNTKHNKLISDHKHYKDALRLHERTYKRGGGR